MTWRALLFSLLVWTGISTHAVAFSLDWLDPAYYFADSVIPHDVVITGLEKEEALLEEYDFEEIAEEAIDPTNPPQNADELLAISGLMAARLTDFLQAQGYYDAYVRSSMRLEKQEEEEYPILTFDIKLLRRYLFISHRIVWVNAPTLESDNARTFPQTVIRNGLVEGQPLTNVAIMDATQEIKRRLMKGRCYLSLDVTPRLMLDRVKNTAEVQFRVTHGGEANFGKTRFTGESSVNPDTLAHYIKWQQGECFTHKKIDATTSTLLQSRLLGRAAVTPDIKNIQDGEVPLTIEVKDRPHRTITAGGYYASSEGLGTRLGWEHRNMQGKAHRLTSRLAFTGIEQSLSGQYTIPFFLRPEQNLQLSSSVRKDDTNAFQSTNIAALVALERYVINPTWLVGAGMGMRIADITDARGNDKFGFIYIPAFMQWDSRNDYFDATEGVFVRGSITPYSDVIGQGVYFVKSDITAQSYLNINALYSEALQGSALTAAQEDDGVQAELFPYSPVIALRASYGQINGASRADVPADLRFYAGGGGSVRGYNFQAIGQREAGLPAGGTIKFELNTELRMRFNEQFGGILFMDAGHVTTGNAFDVNEPLFYGVGVGARYYSPIGPIRFDVGIPLQEVEDKSSFGVYISIGQAF
jgi:translocation and assembly module TamA